MLPSIKTALLFDTFVADNGSQYIAIYRGENLVWEKMDGTDTCTSTKKGRSNKVPSISPSSVSPNTVMKGGDGNKYIAIYDGKGSSVWKRHQTKYKDTSCVVTHVRM